MSTTTYYAMTADKQLAAAQQVLDTHVTSSATGRCLACGSLGPCYRRENAVVVFSRTLRLPRRQPGATQPELTGTGGSTWDGFRLRRAAGSPGHCSPRAGGSGRDGSSAPLPPATHRVEQGGGSVSGGSGRYLR